VLRREGRLLAELARVQTMVAGFDQQPKHGKAILLGKRRQGSPGVLYFHVS